MSKISFFFCSAAIAFVLGPHCAFATDGEIFGGPGGGYYRQECPAGEYLVGLNGRTGAWLDAVQIICAPRIGKDWRIGDSVTRATPAGGHGGASHAVQCESGAAGRRAVIGLKAPLTQGSDAPNYVGGVMLSCADFQPPFADSGAYAALSASGDNDEPGNSTSVVSWERSYGTSNCPAGEVGVGIQGRSGDFVDALGILCAAPAPPPPPPSLVTKMGAGALGDHIAPPAHRKIGTVRTPGSTTEPPAVLPPGPPVAPSAPPPPAYPAGFAPPNIFYAITRAGALNWYQHKDAESLQSARLNGPTIVGLAKWNSFYELLAGGGNHFYGLTREGDLLWYQHDGAANGTIRWKGPVKINSHFENFNDAFGGGEGVIYVITVDGALHWGRHTGFATGNAMAWMGDRVVATGWSQYRLVCSAGQGVIYAIGAKGELLRFRHLDYLTGGTRWEGPVQVGSGWDKATQIFSTGNGVLYAVTTDSQLLYFRHGSWNAATPDESWIGPVTVSNGWSVTEGIVPMIPLSP